MTNLLLYGKAALLVTAVGVSIAALLFASKLAIETLWRWLISKASECGEIPCPTCGQNVAGLPTDATTENTTPKPARRSLNPYREIRRLKQEVADAVACRDETQRLLEMQYVSMVEVVKAVNYMSTTGIAIQTKVGKA